MPIKRIFSAGGIVLRQVFNREVLDSEVARTRRAQTESAQDEVSKKPAWEVLVTQHSKHKGWDFPKGHREIYESEEQAALREVEEEVGVKAEIIERVGQTQYFYYEEGERVMKTVVYYLMKYVGEGEVTTAYEVSDMAWLPVDEVEEKLTFKDTKELWRKIKHKVERLTTND